MRKAFFSFLFFTIASLTSFAQDLITSGVLTLVTDASTLSAGKIYVIGTTTSDGDFIAMCSPLSSNHFSGENLTHDPSLLGDDNLFTLDITTSDDDIYVVLIQDGTYYGCSSSTTSDLTYLYSGTSASKVVSWLVKTSDEYGVYLQMSTVSTTRCLGYYANYYYFRNYTVGPGNSSTTIYCAFLYEYSAPLSSITIATEEGYATYYDTLDFVMPEGLQGTMITGLAENEEGNSGELTMNWEFPEGSTVPAGTALLVNGTYGTTYYLFEPEEETTEEDEDDVVTEEEELEVSGFSICTVDTSSNLLMGTTEDATTTAPNEASADDYYFYKLYYSNSVLGFYWGEESGGTFTNLGGKAYLAIPKSMFDETSISFAIGFSLGESSSEEGDDEDSDDSADKGDANEETGIEALYASSPSEGTSSMPVVYDLRGCRLHVNSLSSLPKGIYIVDGQKMVVK